MGWRRIDVRIGARLLGIGLAALLAGTAGYAEPTSESLVRDLRIGFLVSPVEVLLPIEIADDPQSRFTDRWRYRERDVRRRNWMKRIEANPKALFETPLRLPIGATVTVLHDGNAHPAVIDGFGSLAAGCGETEPSWRLHLRSPLADPGLWHWNDWAREHSPTPVLINLGTRADVQPSTLAYDDDLPAGLLSKLAAAGLLEGENRSLRAGPIWVVYGAPTFDAEQRPVGAMRSIWLESEGRYHLRHRINIHPNVDSLIWKAVSSDASRTQSFVGQVHALLNHAGYLFLLTRRLGWESDFASLGRLGDGTLDPVLIDGIDKGC